MDSVDGLDAILIEQTLNYHGEELQKTWDEVRGKDELSVLLVEKPNFEVYEQREKTLCQSDNEKRQRLQKFIAKKADILYSKSNLEKSVEPVSQYVDHEVAYGTMPGLDSFIKIDESQRVRNFLESLVTGDIIYTQVMGKSSTGLLLKVLCNCSDCPRVVPELTVKALILNTCTVPAVDKNGVTREYMVDDLVCVCVKDVNVEAERIIASMNITPREGLIPHPPLGLIDSSELPDIYRRIVENKGEFFESILENSPGFCNPNNTKYLSDLLLLGQDNHSHMIGLRDGFPLDEYSVKLRQIQSSKWAFRYVTDGIDHFQEGRNSEAFKCLNKALLIDPLNEEGLVARGCLHTTNGKLDKAVDDFEMAIKLNQSHVNARKYLLETLVALGRNYEDEKEFDKALEVFNKCLTIDPCHEIAKNEIEYLKLGGMEEDDEHSTQVLNTIENQNDSQNPTTKLDKKKQKRRKITRKKRKCSSSSSSSSSDSSQSESSSSSSSSESRSSTSSSSHKKSLDSKIRASLSPLSKRMSMYNILPETNDDLLDLEGPRDIGSEDDTKDYELKVRKFLDKSKDDSDYEDKVRIFFKTAARWKMEREEEKKQNNEKIKKKRRKERKSRAKDERREKLYKKEDRKKYKSRRRKFENNGMSPLQDLPKGNSNYPAYFANHEEESQLFYHESRISPQSTSTSSDKYRNANDSRHKTEINKAWDDFSIDSTGGKHKNYSYENESNNSSNPQKQMRNHHSQQISSPKERTVPKEIFDKQFENKNNSKSFESSQNNVNGNSHSPEAFARGMNEERYFNRLRSRSCSSSSSQSSRLRFARRSRSRSFSIRSRKSGSFERKYSRSISRSYSRSPPKYRSKSFSRSRSRSPRSEERKYRFKQQPPLPPQQQQQRVFNNRGGRYNSRFQEWFEFFDEITKTVAARQVWTVMPYTNYAFVIWHFDLASQQSSKLSYPLTVSEVNQKLTRNRAILTTSQKSCRIDKLTLTLDISPLLPELLAPRLRSVSAHLYSSKEKAELMHLVNVMLDYGLTLIQEKKPEGGFEYNLEPDLLQIGTFPDCKFRRGLSYAVKQIVIQELEVERVKRAAALVNSASNKQEKQKRVDVTQEFEKNDEKDDCELKSAMPNNMKQTLEPVEVKPITGKYRDFFKQFKDAGQTRFAEQHQFDVTEPFLQENASVKKVQIFKTDVTYKFKEGYTNAVRRKIKMEDLL